MKFRSIALAFVGFTASCVLASDPAPRSTIDLKIDVTPEPEFPTALAQAGYIEGSAAAIIVVDETGQLRDHLLIDASHRLFGAELLRVIPQWRYTAPLKAGVPVTAARRVEVRFNASGAVISIFGHNAVLLRSPLVAQALHDKLRYQIASPRDLDQPLTATKVVPPQAPPLQFLGGQERSVLFQFFIDETGRVRIPIPVRDSSEPIESDLLDSAHQALSQWRFSPPTVNGEPVVTQATQPFRFSPRENETTPTGQAL